MQKQQDYDVSVIVGEAMPTRYRSSSFTCHIIFID